MPICKNLFSYATSELSQDAFICWLAANFDSDDAVLREISQQLLRTVLGLPSGGSDDEPVLVQDVLKQWNHADVALTVSFAGRRYLIVIEDKTFSGVHDDQLERYRETAEREISGDVDEIRMVYYKMEVSPERDAIDKQCDAVIGRKQILAIMDQAVSGVPYGELNAILADYYAHLKERDRSYEEFRVLPADRWQNDQFCGFFEYLQHEMKTRYPHWHGDYGHNNNPNGGHWTMWCWTDIEVGAPGQHFQVNIESPNRLLWDTGSWVCRALVRWNGADDRQQKSVAELGVPPVNDRKFRRRKGRYTVVGELFAIDRGSAEAQQGYEALRDRIYVGYDEYERWCLANRYERQGSPAKS